LTFRLAWRWSGPSAARSELAAEIHDLHEDVMFLCAAIFVGVSASCLVGVPHRKSKGPPARAFHETPR